MKKMMLALALVISSPWAQAGEACMKNMKAVEENEKSDGSCKASYLKNLYRKFGNQTLLGPMGYKVKFLDMTSEMAVHFNGKKYSGAVCCVKGKWSMKNSLGSKSISAGQDGIYISGYQFAASSGAIASSSGESFQSNLPGGRR